MKTENKQMLLFIIPLIIIMIISFLDMYNAKFLTPIYNKHLIKQIMWYIIGFLILFIVPKINSSKIFKYSFLFYIISNILLLLVLFIGKEINGAKAWFDLKIISFQPSEFAKLALALFLINVVNEAPLNNYKDEFKLIMKVIILTLIPSILVFLEPDTGAILFFFLLAFFLLLASKIHKRWFVILFIIILTLLITFIILYIYNPDLLINILGTSFFYRVERIITFTQENSYQLDNALTVIGSASFLGTGIGHISLYIPEAPTDFILAFTIGNFGLITGFILLIAYFCLDLYFLKTYFQVQDKKIKLFIFSFISVFFFQTFINIFMNLGLLPIIGIPLPFLSYGGSTIIVYFLFIALIMGFVKTDTSFIL